MDDDDLVVVVVVVVGNADTADTATVKNRKNTDRKGIDGNSSVCDCFLPFLISFSLTFF